MWQILDFSFRQVGSTEGTVCIGSHSPVNPVPAAELGREQSAQIQACHNKSHGLEFTPNGAAVVLWGGKLLQDWFGLSSYDESDAAASAGCWTSAACLVKMSAFCFCSSSTSLATLSSEAVNLLSDRLS